MVQSSFPLGVGQLSATLVHPSVSISIQLSSEAAWQGHPGSRLQLVFEVDKTVWVDKG